MSAVKKKKNRKEKKQSVIEWKSKPPGLLHLFGQCCDERQQEQESGIQTTDVPRRRDVEAAERLSEDIR